jgi:hypothetical protein
MLLAAGGGAEHLRRAHAGVEQYELVAEVHDRRILFQHDTVWGQEIVSQHLAHFVVGHAGEGALGVAEGQRTVGNDRDLGAADVEAIEVLWLRSELWRLRLRDIAQQGRCAEACAQRKQRPSRNIRCHASSSTVDVLDRLMTAILSLLMHDRRPNAFCVCRERSCVS